MGSLYQSCLLCLVMYNFFCSHKINKKSAHSKFSTTHFSICSSSLLQKTCDLRLCRACAPRNSAPHCTACNGASAQYWCVSLPHPQVRPCLLPTNLCEPCRFLYCDALLFLYRIPLRQTAQPPNHPPQNTRGISMDLLKPLSCRLRLPYRALPLLLLLQFELQCLSTRHVPRR